MKTNDPLKLAQEIREAHGKTTPGTYKSVGIRGWTVVAEGAKTIPVADFLPRSFNLADAGKINSWNDAAFFVLAHNLAPQIATTLEEMAGAVERLQSQRDRLYRFVSPLVDDQGVCHYCFAVDGHEPDCIIGEIEKESDDGSAS